jgi:uncharacterized protein YbcV (DUF1398 family)
MRPETQATSHQLAEESSRGDLGFGEVVRRLSAAGVESYHADYRAGQTRYYMPSGESTAVALQHDHPAIAEGFDIHALQDAIRGAQGGSVRYPEFVARSRAAGCVGYVVWIAGQHVTYFGRRGEQHVERLPTSP